MRIFLGLGLIWLAGCSSSSADCVMNPGACSAAQVCNQQTAMCQDAPKAAAWSVDANSGKLAPSDLNKVWGSSAQDVWAVGLQGAIVHYEVARV